MENDFFKAAWPIWIEGRDKEWNVSAEISYYAKELKNAVLVVTGASFYQVHIGEKLIHFGPAKKLSTIKEADVILVMNNGRIIEKGDHETLLKCGGFYSESWNSQFEK